jgi:hypothetical protein
MAYDRYDPRRDWREGRPRGRDDDRDFRRERGSDRDRGSDERSWAARDREERGWFERAGDEIASWFGDEEAERRRRQEQPDRFSGRPHLRNEEDVQRFYGNRDREPGREFGRRERAFMTDEDFGRPRWRDEGYRRPYTGRFTGRQGFGEPGPDRGEREPYRPLAGDYGRGIDDRMEQGASFYGVGAHHDRHYGEWRARQLDELDRDYDDYARENRARFEDDFTNWRGKRQEKRQLLVQIREHMEVVGSDGEHVGTVDRGAGDRLILAKSDPDSGGVHHSLMCTVIDRVEGDKVVLDLTAEDARKQWRDESRDRALFERDDQGEAGPGILNRSFSGTY